jgi:hypothetical protein
MNIAITGHTSGLGKSLFEHFNKDHECIGFSRSNGYNITKTYHDILEQLADVDVFFNNAWADQTQSNFIVDCCKYRNLKMIISGSTTTDFPNAGNQGFNYKYFQDKTHIENTFKEYNRYYYNRCLFLKLGYLENRMKETMDIVNHHSQNFYPIYHSKIINLINFWFTNTSLAMVVLPSIPKLSKLSRLCQLK